VSYLFPSRRGAKKWVAAPDWFVGDLAVILLDLDNPVRNRFTAHFVIAM
jgi:hypothetical protein